MKQPKTLTAWDFPNTLQVPDGWDNKTVIDNTRDNMDFLMNEHNNLVEVVNMLCDKRGILFDEEK